MKDIKAVVNNQMEKQGMPIGVLSKRTGIVYDKLYKSLTEGYTRKLSSVELIKVCVVLNLTLNDFVEAE